jgi:hypothetical protein
LGRPGPLGAERLFDILRFNTGLVSLLLITYWPV